MRAVALLIAGSAGALAFAPPRAPVHDALAVTWEPAQPLEGSLVRITIAAAPGGQLPRELAGSLSGERLHFERRPDGRFATIAAVPLGARDSVSLVIARLDAAAPDTAQYVVPVLARPVERERLRIAPRFTRPPDSALAARLVQERRMVARVLHGTHERPRLWTEPFLQPRTARITSPYGQGRAFNADSSISRHRGTDFAGELGAPVRAANRGVVALVGHFYYAGTAVYLDHGAGLVTAYLHLSAAAVTQGDTVARGQVVGSVGATGRVTGPHLHWSALYGRIGFDPLDLLSLPAPPGADLVGEAATP